MSLTHQKSSIKKIFILIIFILLLISFGLIIFRVNTFIPSMEYKIFAYVYSIISVAFLVYETFLNNPNLDENKKRKNIIVAPLVFIVLYFFSLSGMFYGLTSILQYLPSQDRTLIKKVILTFENTGRASNIHGFKVENSYFYGSTNKKTVESLQIGDNIIFYGKENLFGFYANKFVPEKMQQIK